MEGMGTDHIEGEGQGPHGGEGQRPHAGRETTQTHHVKGMQGSITRRNRQEGRTRQESEISNVLELQLNMKLIPKAKGERCRSEEVV